MGCEGLDVHLVFMSDGSCVLDYLVFMEMVAARCVDTQYLFS